MYIYMHIFIHMYSHPGIFNEPLHIPYTNPCSIYFRMVIHVHIASLKENPMADLGGLHAIATTQDLSTVVIARDP